MVSSRAAIIFISDDRHAGTPARHLDRLRARSGTRGDASAADVAVDPHFSSLEQSFCGSAAGRELRNDSSVIVSVTSRLTAATLDRTHARDRPTIRSSARSAGSEYAPTPPCPASTSVAQLLEERRRSRTGLAIAAGAAALAPGICVGARRLLRIHLHLLEEGELLRRHDVAGDLSLPLMKSFCGSSLPFTIPMKSASQSSSVQSGLLVSPSPTEPLPFLSRASSALSGS